VKNNGCGYVENAPRFPHTQQPLPLLLSMPMRMQGKEEEEEKDVMKGKKTKKKTFLSV
jgi:hypothetical protein